MRTTRNSPWIIHVWDQRKVKDIEHNGIRGQIEKWIRSFLDECIQRGGHLSAAVHVTSGVPQGTVLAPFSFQYISTAYQNVLSTKNLFANDCLLYQSRKTLHDTDIFQTDLHNLERWEDWWMFFNPPKCEVLRITSKKTPKKTPPASPKRLFRK